MHSVLAGSCVHKHIGEILNLSPLITRKRKLWGILDKKLLEFLKKSKINHSTTQLADIYHLRIALINALYGPIREAVMMHYLLNSL